MPNSHVLISWLVVYFHSTTWNPSEYLEYYSTAVYLGQVHRHTQPHLLLLLPSSTAAAAARKTDQACVPFFSLSLYPKSQLGNPLIVSSRPRRLRVGVILRSILRNDNPSASTPARLVKSVGSGKRVKRPRPFFLFTRTETSDY